jgi:hypothetical protein
VSNSPQNLPLFAADLLTIRQPPRELLADVRSLVKDGLSYNHLLKTHGAKPVSEWPEAPKQTFLAIVVKAKLLTRAFEGMLVSDNPLANPRRFWGDSGAIRRLTAAKEEEPRPPSYPEKAQVRGRVHGWQQPFHDLSAGYRHPIRSQVGLYSPVRHQQEAT